MAVTSIKAVLPCEINKVWELVFGVENYGAWRSDLSKIEVVNNRQFIEYTKDGYSTKFTVTLVEPYARWEFEMENSNMTGHWIGVFTERGDETEIDFTECVKAKKWFMKPVCKVISEKTASTVCCGFKKGIGKDVDYGRYDWVLWA